MNPITNHIHSKTNYRQRSPGFEHNLMCNFREAIFWNATTKNILRQQFANSSNTLMGQESNCDSPSPFEWREIKQKNPKYVTHKSTYCLVQSMLPLCVCMCVCLFLVAMQKKIIIKCLTDIIVARTETYHSRLFGMGHDGDLPLH